MSTTKQPGESAEAFKARTVREEYQARVDRSSAKSKALPASSLKASSTIRSPQQPSESDDAYQTRLIREAKRPVQEKGESNETYNARLALAFGEDPDAQPGPYPGGPRPGETAEEYQDRIDDSRHAARSPRAKLAAERAVSGKTAEKRSDPQRPGETDAAYKARLIREAK